MTLTTRLAIAMIALVAIAVSAVGWLSYRNLEQALLQRARDRIETHSRQVATDLEYYAASATGDSGGSGDWGDSGGTGSMGSIYTAPPCSAQGTAAILPE